MAVDKVTAELAALEQHLDVFGSEVERWPAEARLRFEPLLASEARARELLDEARALDRLLDRAPLPNEARMKALADRIVGHAIADANASAQTAAPVIDLASWRRRGPQAQPFRWKVASALAASLIVGIFIGTAPPVISAVESIAASVGGQENVDPSDLALFDDGTSDDEDLL